MKNSVLDAICNKLFWNSAYNYSFVQTSVLYPANTNTTADNTFLLNLNTGIYNSFVKSKLLLKWGLLNPLSSEQIY